MTSDHTGDDHPTGGGDGTSGGGTAACTARTGREDASTDAVDGAF